MTETLRITSIQAPNADASIAAIAAYLQDTLQQSVEFVDGIPWTHREALLDAGEVQAGWICGLPYVFKADGENPDLELLAAPVMSGERYAGRPVYFSDVMVREDSAYQSFEALRGSRWAYNEPRSHSGHNLTRYHLAMNDWKQGFFGEVVQADSHELALQMILDGEIDASAIDSTVLETEYISRPEIKDQMRCIKVLGPSPIPPWVIHKSMSRELRQVLGDALLGMHESERGRQILADHRMARFVAVNDGDYDAIREMYTAARGVEW